MMLMNNLPNSKKSLMKRELRPKQLKSFFQILSSLLLELTQVNSQTKFWKSFCPSRKVTLRLMCHFNLTNLICLIPKIMKIQLKSKLTVMVV